MAATGEGLRTNVAQDMSVLKSPILMGKTGFLQLMQSYHVGTEEVKDALVQHCDFIMECKICRSLFRGLPNFLAHKRHYCIDPNKNFEASMENVRIVHPSSSSFFCDQPETQQAKNRPQSSLSPNKKSSLLLQTLMGDAEHAKYQRPTPKSKVLDVDGQVPISSEGVIGLHRFLQHHKLSDKSGLICKLCDFTSGDSVTLRWHINTVHIKRPNLVQCTQCKKVYTDNSKLHAHLVTDHNVLIGDTRKYMVAKSKVEKYVIHGKVYDAPTSEKEVMANRKDFKEENQKIVLALFKCLGVLKFTNEAKCRAFCKVHSQNLEGFQNVRRHMVEFHLSVNNVCMFCKHEVAFMGHIVKHMVIAHEFSVEAIASMPDKVRRHFASPSDLDMQENNNTIDDEDESGDADTEAGGEDAPQAEVEEEVVDETVDQVDEKTIDDDQCSGISEISYDEEDDVDDDPEISFNDSGSTKSSVTTGQKRQLSEEESSPPSKAKRPRLEVDAFHGKMPVQAKGVTTLRKFIHKHKLISSTGQCRFCPAIMNSYKTQKRHLQRKHLVRQNLYQCKIRVCRLVFQKQQSLKNHVFKVHGMKIGKDASSYIKQKLVLEGGKVYDVPERYLKKIGSITKPEEDDIPDEEEEKEEEEEDDDSEDEETKPSVTESNSDITMHTQTDSSGDATSPESSGMSAAVLYSAREMTLAVITCMYIIKFQVSPNQVAQCVHHPEVKLTNFTAVIEHLVVNHIKDDYSCTMCPFRRKDAVSLVKHMSGSHHLSVDRIQRMKERIRSSFRPTEVTGRSKFNIPHMSLKAIEEIVFMLTKNVSQDYVTTESFEDDKSSVSTSSAPISPVPSVPLVPAVPPVPSVPPPAPVHTSKDLLYALIECLNVMQFHSRPVANNKRLPYVASCEEHSTRKLTGMPDILEHLVDHHLKVVNTCCLCGFLCQSLDQLANHMSRDHNISPSTLMSMREGLRFSLLRKPVQIKVRTRAPKTKHGKLFDNVLQFTLGRGIVCPHVTCDQTFATFKKIQSHMIEGHYLSVRAATNVVNNLRSSMKRAKVLQKDGEEAPLVKEDPVKVKTKSGRLVQRGSMKKASMFGLDDYKCQTCFKVYPSLSKIMSHMREMHVQENMKCKLCSFVCPTLTKLIAHLRETHDLQVDMKSGAEYAILPFESSYGGPQSVDEASTETKARSDDKSSVDVSPADEPSSCADTKPSVGMGTAKSGAANRNRSESRARSGDRSEAPTSTHTDSESEDEMSTEEEVVIRENRGERRSRRSQHALDGHDEPSMSLFGREDVPCLICMKSFPSLSHLKSHMHTSHHLERSKAASLIQKLKLGAKPKVTSKSKVEEVEQIPEIQSRRKQMSPRKAEEAKSNSAGQTTAVRSSSPAGSKSPARSRSPAGGKTLVASNLLDMLMKGKDDADNVTSTTESSSSRNKRQLLTCEACGKFTAASSIGDLEKSVCKKCLSEKLS